MLKPRYLVLLVIFLLVSGLMWSGESAAATASKIEPGLLQDMQAKGEGTYWVYLTEQANLRAAYSISDWSARGHYVYDSLRQLAETSQAGLVAELNAGLRDGTVVKYDSYFIVNAILVTSTVDVMSELAARSDVAQITAQKTYYVTPLEPEESAAAINALEWGIAIVNADDVWNTFGARGAGVVVANVDTGVDYDHPALVAQYRGNLGGSFDHNYNWYDPSAICPPGAPCDNNNHGTHTMGTMVGDDGAANQIGMAPEATWIAAKGCESNSCSDTALLGSAAWLLAPCALGDDPGDPSCNPDMRPDIVNNSWGGGGGDPWYQPSVDAWRAAGIFPSFSAGNSGPAPNTLGSPGDYCNVIGVGGTDINDLDYDFSSRGPGNFPACLDKPDISAPGEGVRSSINGGGYAVFSGTSMASPHVAGCAALLLSIDPLADFDRLYDLMTQNAEDLGTPGFDYTFGNGRLDCYAAALMLQPDFTLSASPDVVNICQPSDALFNVNIGQIQDYTDDVTLSASGNPAGTTASFVPNPVTPPGASVLTIGNTGATMAGAYSIDIIGVAPTSTHTTTVQLGIFDGSPGAPTLLLPTDADTGVGLVPTMSWTAVADAAEYQLRIWETAGMVLVYDQTTTATDHTLVTPLDPLTNYTWQVDGLNPCGSAASGQFTFTTRDIPPILLVDDDDNNPDVRATYTDALDNLGLTYDIWDTGNSDNEPGLAYLLPYDIVIWFSGHEFGGAAGPGSAGETALAGWLDTGKCLFISSQDYHYDRGLTPFMQNYLGVASATDDNGNYTSVTGQGLVFGGLGPYTLAYPFTDFSDAIVASASAEQAWLGNNSNTAGIDKADGVFQTTFLAYPWEAISTPADRQEAMGTFVTWCGAGVSVGTLDGYVWDGDSALPLGGATVTAEASGGIPRTTTTAPDGHYAMTLAVDTYEVTASKPNYAPATVSSVVIVTDTVTNLDFYLYGSHLTYEPAAIEETMDIGDVVTNTVTVTNTGPLAIDWAANIGNFGGPVLLRIDNMTVTPLTGQDAVSPAGASALSAAGTGSGMVLAPPSPEADVNLVLDDGTRENALGLTAGGQFLWLNRFTPDPADFPFTLTEVQVMFGAAVGVNPGELVDIYIWEDTDGDGDPGTGENFLGGETGVQVQAVDDVTWSVYPLTPPIELTGPGDVLIAVVNRTAGTGAGEYPAAMDETASQGRSWVGLYAGNPGDPPALPADSDWGIVDTFGFPANWMVRGYGSFGAAAAWASAVPDAGTIPANSVATFDVVFDARSLFETGDYTAELSFSGTFVNDPPVMSLTMHLGCPTCGFLDGSITDFLTTDPLVAQIHVTGPGGFDVTLNADSYNLAVQPGTYDFEVSADGYLTANASVAVAQGQTITTDFALIPAIAILEYAPPEIEEYMEIGDIVTNTVTVTNTGYSTLTFSVNIGNYGSPGAHGPTSIPASDGNFPRGSAAASVERAPSVATDAAGNVPGLFAPDSPAYGVELLGEAIWSFTLDAASSPTPIGVGWQSAYAGDFVSGAFDTLYAVVNDTTTLYEIDTASGAASVIGPMVPAGGQTWTGMSYDATSATMFALSTDCTTNTLYTLNLATGAVTQVATFTGVCVIDIGVSPDGQMYGIDIIGDTLGTIDKGTGAWSAIGSIGFDANYAQGADFDDETGTLYLAAYNNALGAAQLRIADLTTGNTTLVSNLGAGAGAEVDAFGIAAGGGGVADWAYALPDAGEVPAGATATFEVVFDATGLTTLGDYTAELTFSGNFVNNPPAMPLTMHLSCPTCGTLDGSITDAFTSDPLAADIHITSGGGVDLMLSGDSYAVTVPAGAYDIEVSADGYFSQTATVDAAAGTTVTTNFALVPQVALLEYGPPTVEGTVFLGDSMWTPMVIENVGTMPFDFSLIDIETSRPTAAPAPATVCPADAFGYTCTDSTEGDGLVSYAFEDISGTGTPISLTDDSVSPALPLGFDFDFYGSAYNSVYVSSNGFVAFSTPSSSGCCSGQLLPNPTTPNNLVAGWWEDLNPNSGGTIHYQMMGSAPTRYFIVQFTNIQHFGGGNAVTFQYKLFEGGNNIEIHYDTLASDGGNHSIGIENSTGTVGLSYFYGTAAAPGTPLAVCFLHPDSTACGSGGTDALWAWEDPDAGTVNAGASQEIMVHLEADDPLVITQTGTYEAALYFSGTFDNEPAPGTFIMNVVQPGTTAIMLETTVSTDGSCGTSDYLLVPAGTDVTYCYTVTNMGDNTLSGHVVTDSVMGEMMAFDYALHPGASESMLMTMAITETIDSESSWWAFTTGTEDTATDQTLVEVIEPSIVLTQTLSADGSCGTQQAIEVRDGEDVTFCYEVENTGNITLTLHSLEDVIHGTLLLDQPYTLAPGASFVYMTTTTMDEAPPYPVEIENCATWTATSGLYEANAQSCADITVTTPEFFLYLPVVWRP